MIRLERLMQARLGGAGIGSSRVGYPGGESAITATISSP
jgi:hypothetical protein